MLGSHAGGISSWHLPIRHALTRIQLSLCREHGDLCRGQVLVHLSAALHHHAVWRLRHTHIGAAWLQARGLRQLTPRHSLSHRWCVDHLRCVVSAARRLLAGISCHCDSRVLPGRGCWPCWTASAGIGSLRHHREATLLYHWAGLHHGCLRLLSGNGASLNSSNLGVLEIGLLILHHVVLARVPVVLHHVGLLLLLLCLLLCLLCLHLLLA